MSDKTETLLSILKSQPVMPVLIIERVEDAVPLARALAAGGLKAIEVTLRTPVALEAIRAIAEGSPDTLVGAGTILSPEDYEAAVKAGSKFIVSPGATPALFAAAKASDVPFLPGTSSASEIMLAREAGLRVVKFFPAEQSGGAPFLKAISSPIADMKFCPTGGISLKNANDYLSLPNVVCVGGSWVAPKDMVVAGDWAGITKLAAEAAALR
ncbi:2-dehydro-3-deoxy-phosphogluconate aldolase [Allorhizobium borbori]|uniref:2-dehydro-3-deoxy-phosphogluconate aldolase n=1 Tax=Allorhizobium borbori TaxID=485907 RepID=A0A7W6JYZ3_9HYPH|nr:2-dehydro-3-deoxy-phosphogluconate aldolase [Allorhizobium borbori]MBB4102132.1 2-dehydro-3-deoxyphosphogluconate aldolase/(4S)-4-hydroxy-2-oxoglutarate aldolase [Allorhizobium borbori]